jgi:hypothetical protein
LNFLNKHFVSSPNFDSKVKNNTLKLINSLPSFNCDPFLFSQFSDSDVKKAFMTISFSAVGCDSISRKMLLPILDDILPLLSYILNFSITTGVFPSIWKDAKLIPLPKKPNPLTFSKYRPISILRFLSKVLERLVHWQINNFLHSNNFLNPFQSGFRLGHSTATALVKITEDIRSGIENGDVTLLILLDFIIFINTISKQQTSSYHLYADDLQIYVQSPVSQLNYLFFIFICLK